jgi:hypothetical protein
VLLAGDISGATGREREEPAQLAFMRTQQYPG